MAVTVVPAGSRALTGVSLLLVVPSPSCPSRLSPQASTWPVEVSARLNTQPARTEVTLVPRGILTLTGTSLLVVVPLPSWPSPLAPQAST